MRILTLLWLGVAIPAAAQDSTPFLGHAHWIADANALGLDPRTRPFPLLRKTFTVSATSPVVRATLYATALGSYQATINGQPVSQAVLTPDWTDYRHRVEYQTYDVTPLIHSGPNAIGIMLGEGWFGSPMNNVPPYTYAPPPVRFMGLLEIVHADSTKEIIASDRSWHATSGPVISSQIYDGETYDARRIPTGWNSPTFDDRMWPQVAELPSVPGVAVVPQIDPTIERVSTLVPVSRQSVGGDTLIFDMGQNMVGWVRLVLHGASGDTVRVRHAELVTKDGRYLDTASLRGVAATDRYTLRGDSEEAYEPHFTYHGFRYVEIVTSPGVRIDSMVGIVVHTAARETIAFESSNDKLNRLWANAQWGLRGNLIGVPTDCPQRYERMGWLGDAAAFWPTGVYFMDLRTFTRKWLQDMRDSQLEDSTDCFPAVSPASRRGCGGPGWSDGGVLIPAAAYRQYGDTAMVREHWGAMVRYMHFIAGHNAQFVWRNYLATDRHFPMGFGDWAAPPGADSTGPTLIATAFWAADALALQDMARGLGDTTDVRQLGELYAHIRTAFAGTYISPDGIVGERSSTGRWLSSQTSDVLALTYHLVPDSLRTKVAQHLVVDITKRGNHLATGFAGTPRLLPALSDAGYDSVAYTLLLTESMPSWLYEVDHGATTPWEHWNADTRDDAPSFNHYVNGSVAEWLIRYAAGIGQDSGSAAFDHIVIHPHLDPSKRLKTLAIRYDSPAGPIASAWTINPSTGAVTLTVTIPPHHTARVDVPVCTALGYRYVTHRVSAGTHTFR